MADREAKRLRLSAVDVVFAPPDVQIASADIGHPDFDQDAPGSGRGTGNSRNCKRLADPRKDGDLPSVVHNATATRDRQPAAAT